ncbi:MAG TPA: (d)CMP kinase [Acidimicrobiales bacterium]|nr:(d)CMP kinase [Acidimicrobiales bacterium]
MTGPLVIAIDGPAGSGKSTVARLVAERLGVEVLDTGAMYRAITVLAQRAGLDLTEADKVTLVAAEAALEVGDRVRSHGVDLTDALRTDEVNAGVSVVSAHPGVRAVLVAEQRAWIGGRDGAVVEGRDIGTVVWPEARVKVYLTASDAERARRRTEEPGDSVARRDQLDERRATSPLRAAEDAHVLDTTDRAVEDVVAEILGLL